MSSTLPAQLPSFLMICRGGMVHKCVHICSCGCSLRTQQSGGVHTHMHGHTWLCTGPCLRDTSCKPTAFAGVTSLFSTDRLISRDFQEPQQQRDSHFLGTIEARETWSPDSNCNFHLPLPHFLHSSLEDPFIIPQRCNKDEMHLRTSCQQKGCQQRMG